MSNKKLIECLITGDTDKANALFSDIWAEAAKRSMLTVNEGVENEEDDQDKFYDFVMDSGAKKLKHCLKH